MKKLLPYLQLVRLPNVFTAMADITAGYVFVRGDLSPPSSFALLLIASSLLYMAGMVLNDLFDVQQDSEERPHRPIPSGNVSQAAASSLGWGMLLAGVAVAWIPGFLSAGSESAGVPFRSGVIATILAMCIVAYDAMLKRTVGGPVFMGACRFFNILLGMSVASQVACGGPQLLLRYEYGQILVAGAVGIYIAGVTWFARTEAKESSKLQLSAALFLMMAGLLMLASYPWMPDKPAIHFRGLNVTMWQGMVVLLAVTIGRSALMAVLTPSPERVQYAVKTAIMSLIIVDGAICVVAGPVFAIGVLALLVPSYLLGRWIYST